VSGAVRVVVVDDEKLARDRLGRMLKKLDDVDLVGEAGNGGAAVELIDAAKPDVVFLDVQMPGMDGFAVLEGLSHSPEVVFATAHDEYAIKAFEVHAVDYLLKPIARDRLDRSLSRVRRRLESQTSPDWRELVESVRNPARRFPEQVPAHKGKQILLLPIKDICWFEVEYRLVYAHTATERYMTNFTLKELEDRLDPEVFFRAHKSRLVNLRFVQAIVPWFGGRYKLVMRDEGKSELELSRAQARVLRRRMSW
jgi:DNA-binding LytR/AlgR family response regulator